MFCSSNRGEESIEQNLKSPGPQRNRALGVRGDQGLLFERSHSYDEYTLSSSHIRGVVVGAAILTIFGGFWLIVALAYFASRPGWSIPVGGATTLTLLVLCLVRLAASQKFPRVNDPTDAAKGRRAGKLFGIVFAVESALIAGCSTLLASRGLGLWIPIATAAIVGFHFLPLARVFEMAVYRWTGIACLLAALGCLPIHDFGRRLLCLGLLMTAILWLSAVLLLVQTRLSRLAPA